MSENFWSLGKRVPFQKGIRTEIIDYYPEQGIISHLQDLNEP
jgi:hypothetical protein